MQSTIIQTIIKQKKTCYFISPHFDDAILSSGALINYLSKHTKIIVINVFTKSGEKPYTLSAKAYLKQCGYTDAKKLYTDRKNEDTAILKNLTDNIVNLDFTDALWRKKYTQDLWSRIFNKIPELQLIYPTYRYHVIKGKVAKQDRKTIELIKQKLQENIKDKDVVVFCPLGTGHHIDHVITRLACEQLFSGVIYWSDFPYNKDSVGAITDLRSFSFEQDLHEKRRMIEGYTTQYNAMFSKGLTIPPEIFFTKKV